MASRRRCRLDFNVYHSSSISIQARSRGSDLVVAINLIRNRFPALWTSCWFTKEFRSPCRFYSGPTLWFYDAHLYLPGPPCTESYRWEKTCFGKGELFITLLLLLYKLFFENIYYRPNQLQTLTFSSRQHENYAQKINPLFRLGKSAQEWYIIPGA